ncbi:hypothetical protein ABPG72_017063 [Tetrahymena utriculariae]
MKYFSRFLITFKLLLKFNMTNIATKINQNYSNILLTIIIVISGCFELLIYLGVQIDQNNYFEISQLCAQEIQNIQTQQKQQLIRAIIMACIILFMLISFATDYFIGKKYAHNGLYFQIIIIFFLVEIQFQQAIVYLQILWMVLYFLYSQKFVAKFIRRKYTSQISVILSLFYLFLRAFAVYGFQVGLLLFSIAIFIFQILCLFFCTEVGNIQEQIKQYQDCHFNNQKGHRSSSKGFVGLENLQQKGINLKNSPFQSKEDNFINGINFILQEKQDQFNLEIKQKLRSIGIQDQKEQTKDIDQQESNECFYKYQEFFPQKEKSNVISSKNDCKENDLKIPILEGNDGNSQVIYSLNPFFYTSLQGIAIFNCQKRLIFENQQIQIILNLFDKKETSSETILYIKLTKDQTKNKENSCAHKEKDNYDQEFNESQKIDSKSFIQLNDYSSQIPNSFATKQTSQLYFQQNTEQTQQSNNKQDLKVQNHQLDIQIKKVENSDNQNRILDDQNIQKSDDKAFDFLNQSSNCLGGGQGGIFIGSTCDKVNELNEYQNANMISPSAKGEQYKFINNQKKTTKNNQFFQSEVQIDYSNIIQESQNNLNASYYGNKLNEIKKSLGKANQQTDNQFQEQLINSHRQINQIQKKNTFIVQECGQNNSQDFFFKKKEDLKSNQKLLDLIKSKSDCSIKDMLSILLDPTNYQHPNKQYSDSHANRFMQIKNDWQEKGYSNYDSYDSYTPINSKLTQQSIQKQMLCLNNKAFKHMFDIVVDDSSILIQKLIQLSNIVVTIKITILQQYSLCKEDNVENLYAFFEFTTSSQEMNQNFKQEYQKTNKIEHLTESISWIERKLTAVLEPCIQRVNLFKQYCNRGFQNFTAEEQKTIFITPLYNSLQLIFNILENVKNFVLIKQDKFNLNISQINILNLLSDCLDIFRQQAKQQKIQLELKVQKSLKQTLNTDKLKLQQLIVSILASSIKHTQVGKVQIQIDYITVLQMYRISIQDTGVGIDSHICQKISQIIDLSPDELSEYENLFSNDFPYLDVNDNENQSKNKIEDNTNFSNISYSNIKQQKTLDQKDSYLKYIQFQTLNFIARKLGSNQAIQLNSKLGFGTQFVFHVQDYQEQQSQTLQKTHSNKSLKTQSDDEIQHQCSFEQKISLKNQQEKQAKYSENAQNHFQQQNQYQKKKEPSELNQQILNDKRTEECKSDFNLNSQNMYSDKDKLSSKDQSSSIKNSKFRRKHLFCDNQNLVYDESCNVQSEQNSRLSQNFSQKKTPKSKEFVVSHKVEKISNQQDIQCETSLFKKNKIQCSIKLRKCKTQAGLENSQQNQDNVVEEYDVYQYGIESNYGITYQQNCSINENNSELYHTNQQFSPHQNQYQNQKYPTSFYKCENPMQETNSEQNGSFSDFSSLLQNYFAPSKSQNAILFNNQAHKQSPKSRNNHEYSKNLDGLIKTKSPFKKAYSMRHASSEFIQTEYKSHYQRNTEAQNSFEREDIQKYYVQDSPLFIQSQKAIKALNEEMHSQNVIKKVHTEFTQRNSTVFQGSPRSSASIQSKKTEKNSRFNSKLRICHCNQILVVEQTENSLKQIKENLFNLKLEVDCSLIGTQMLEKVKNKFFHSICCPKYKLILIDREFSQQKASKAVQNINKIYSSSNHQNKPIFCSCEPNKHQPNTIQHDQEDQNFDFYFYKNICSDTFNDIIQLATA